MRDAYPGELEETILTEILANALDSGAARISVLLDPAERTLVVADDGSGMTRRELARYHDIASSSKTRGDGIGFAGVGIKLGLLAAEEVLTETRRGDVHVATRWRLASRQRAPWHWADPAEWVVRQGTAVGLRLRSALSPLLDGGYVEATLRRHFEPLFDHAFDSVLAEHYPSGVVFLVNGRTLPKRGESGEDRAALAVRLPRKHKPSAVGYLERSKVPLPEERQGVAVSTLGKVIRRGWDWLGQTAASPALVAGLIEAPGLAEALTLNKGDFVRTGRRGITYLAYRKAVQEAVGAQLAAWGEARDQEDSARRKAARPLERDIEAVLVELADDFPVLAALVERRAGGQKRLPTGAGETLGAGVMVAARAPVDAVSASEAAAPAHEVQAAIPEPEPTPAEATLPGVGKGPRRPGRYGLSIAFEERPDSADLGRLAESTVWVNTAHPAHLRAVASRSEGYHIALSVGFALAAVAVEAERGQVVLTAFLARWGEALGRDGRRRQSRSG